MPAVEASTVPLAESGLVVKMEDRKRPAACDPNESTPPLKKQATSLNGGAKPHPDSDMPWKDDLEVSISLFFLFSMVDREIYNMSSAHFLHLT